MNKLTLFFSTRKIYGIATAIVAVTIVPSIIVKLFFGSGALREVYTDTNLRILYGSNGKDFTKEAIYIMTRVK